MISVAEQTSDVGPHPVSSPSPTIRTVSAVPASCSSTARIGTCPSPKTPPSTPLRSGPFINLTDDSHPIHLHLVRFQMLDRRPFDVTVYQLTGKIVFTGPAVTLTPNELGWKDIARVDPFTVTRIIIKFEGYAGRYAWRCHMLEHEENEMMRPYVIAPG